MGIFDEFKEGYESETEEMEGEPENLTDALDFTNKKLWRTVDVIDKDEWEEPMALQQQIKYPTSQMVTETTAPLDNHRLVPLSDLVDY